MESCLNEVRARKCSFISRQRAASQDTPTQTSAPRLPFTGPEHQQVSLKCSCLCLIRQMALMPTSSFCVKQFQFLFLNEFSLNSVCARHRLSGLKMYHKYGENARRDRGEVPGPALPNDLYVFCTLDFAPLVPLYPEANTFLVRVEVCDVSGQGGGVWCVVGGGDGVSMVAGLSEFVKVLHIWFQPFCCAGERA